MHHTTRHQSHERAPAKKEAGVVWCGVVWFRLVSFGGGSIRSRGDRCFVSKGMHTQQSMVDK